MPSFQSLIQKRHRNVFLSSDESSFLSFFNGSRRFYHYLYTWSLPWPEQIINANDLAIFCLYASAIHTAREQGKRIWTMWRGNEVSIKTVTCHLGSEMIKVQVLYDDAIGQWVKVNRETGIEREFLKRMKESVDRCEKSADYLLCDLNTSLKFNPTISSLILHELQSQGYQVIIKDGECQEVYDL